VADTREWPALQAVIRKAVAEGRLGRPVFARAFVTGGSAPEEAREALAAMTAMANGWFGAEGEAVRALGDDASTHLCSLLRWPGGQSALLSVGPGSPGSRRLDLTLLGSHGAIYYRTPEDPGGLAA